MPRKAGRETVSALISHLFLLNWHGSISILNFAEEIFFPGMLLHKQKRWKKRAALLGGNALPCVDGEMPHMKFRERSTSTRILWQFIVLETRMKIWLWDSPAERFPVKHLWRAIQWNKKGSRLLEIENLTISWSFFIDWRQHKEFRSRVVRAEKLGNIKAITDRERIWNRIRLLEKMKWFVKTWVEMPVQ